MNRVFIICTLQQKLLEESDQVEGDGFVIGVREMRNI
jgi:hypothetical protein